MDKVLQEFKCPCCGGSIKFDSDTQKMKCPFCDTEFEVDSLKALDDGLAANNPDEISWETTSEDMLTEEEAKNMKVYVCKSCGGEIITDKTTSATSCPYCDSPVVVMENFSGKLKPNYILPFKLDKKAAKEGLINHLKHKVFLPKIFKSENHIDEIKGVYVPFWLFDADTDAHVRYKATKVRTWSDSRYNYTKTSFYSIYRSGNISFERIPVDASQKMDNDLMESIEPFHTIDNKEFQTAYLSGYLADRYDVDAKTSEKRANERLKKSTQDAFASTVKGYTTVTAEASSINVKNGKCNYALLPVWILNTTWNNKKYRFAMNGQTGKFVGNLPVNRFKYWAIWAACFAGVSALAFGLLSLFFLF